MTRSSAIAAVVALLAIVSTISAQSELRIGEWRAFLPYNTGISVTQDADKVYYGTMDAVMSIRKDDLSATFFSKADGLSDVGVNLVKYHAAQNALIVVYRNSNIDVIFEEGIRNIDDVLNNNTIIGSRRINHIFVDQEDQIFLSSDFGLIEFDLVTQKFGFTMFTGTPVHAFAKHDGVFYVATDQGIFRFADFDNQLVSNFNAWERIREIDGLPSGHRGQGVIVYQNQLYAAADGGLYAYDGTFYLVDARDNHNIVFLSAEGPHLKAGFRCVNDGCNGKVHFYDPEGKVGEQGSGCVGRPTDAIEDAQGRVWYADQWRGIRMADARNGSCTPRTFNTPYSNNVSEVAIQDGVLYVAAGGVNDGYGYTFNPDGLFIREAGDWSFFNRTNTSALSEVLDYFRVLPHPDGSRVYVGSYWAGLIEYDFSEFAVFDQGNSPIQGAVGDAARERISGLALDPEGNLWMSNYLAPRPIVVRKVDGNWATFTVPGSTQIGDIAIDQRGYKWMPVIGASSGVLVFDDNGTIDDQNDDRYVSFGTNNSALPTNELTNLTVDRGGDIWVGTEEGPVVFDSALDPFDGGTQGFRIKVELDGLNYLLGDEEITAIAVDGANRKWFGTRNGVFVQSADGEDQIAEFNTANSPLLNDHITDIAIDPTNGDVYIGTQSGLNQVRTDAVAGTPRHQSSAYAFPNPVRPNYDGPIAIRGLAEDAAVKITDVSGTLIYETRALGGQAVWDGRDLLGQQARSGVYLVFSTTESQFDKLDALVTKILFIR